MLCYVLWLWLTDAAVSLCQILSDADLRPQAKHLQSRAEYLLKVLRKQLNIGDRTTVGWF